METDERTRYRFTLWFDYTRQLANEIKEGDLVAIPNFATTSHEKHWSIVEIISGTPTHYALGSNKSDITGYPGYIMEAAGNLPVDWLEQETESLEDTTKIVCEAIPLNMEIIEHPGCTPQNIPITTEHALPMMGAEAKLFSLQLTQRIINLGIDPTVDDVILVGNLVREQSINIFMRVEEAIKTHIGIFGFTGVGKSNFISTMISSLLSRQRDPIKHIIFDLNGEYIGLLMDYLVNPNLNALIVCLGERTLPGPVLHYLNDPQNHDINHAIDAYLHDLYLPRNLRPCRDRFRPHIENLIQSGRLRIIDERLSITVGQFIIAIRDEIFDEYVRGPLKIRIEQLVSDLTGNREGDELNPALATTMLDEIAHILGRLDVDGRQMVASQDTYEKRVGVLVSRLEDIARSGQGQNPSNAGITLTNLINDLNSTNNSTLIIINSHDPNVMRKFSNTLGYWTYEQRRRGGLTHPLVSFIFDEADEFIPSNPPSSSYQDSKKIIEILARRGRKFGLGVIIATQRSAYLDTNIMGQLHTYFISRLPRKYDREAVGEAFSISDEIFRQTFRFQKGDWLYISHEAAGLDATPIPIHAPNAEDRIRRWLGL
jgi:hypothetical protein